MDRSILDAARAIALERGSLRLRLVHHRNRRRACLLRPRLRRTDALRRAVEIADRGDHIAVGTAFGRRSLRAPAARHRRRARDWNRGGLNTRPGSYTAA